MKKILIASFGGAAIVAAATQDVQGGFIGNTGTPQTTTGHVPFFIVGLATDHLGRVYTVHSWDEPHQDIMMWSAANGQKLYNTGQVIPEALLNSIAVEPDGSVAYVAGLTQETPATTFRLYKVQLGSSPGVINFSVAGRSVLLASGQPLFTKFALKVTKRGIEAANPNTGTIDCYDKDTGALKKTSTGTLPDDTQVVSGGYTIRRESVANGAGSRLIGPGWEQRCTEFVGCVSYSQANPNTFISMSRNLYNRSGQWLGCGVADVSKEPSTTGPCKTVTLGGNDFFYFPNMGNSLAIYRINAESMSVVSTLTPSDLALQSFGIAEDGALWLATLYQYSSGESCSVWKLPLRGLDNVGNPIYEWADAIEVVKNSTLMTLFGLTNPHDLTMMMANFNPVDGLVYALVYVSGQGPDRGGAWMAGNILGAFSLDGTLAWKVVLPAPAIGMTVVPTGGVMLGQNVDDNNNPANGTIHRYNASGSLIATISPPPGDTWPIGLPSGAFDCYGAINAQLAPDGLLDIFAEDDFNGRVIWYHIP